MGLSSGQFPLQLWQTPFAQIERMGSAHSFEPVHGRQAPVAVSHTGLDSCGHSSELVHLAQPPSALQMGAFAFFPAHAPLGALLQDTHVPKLQIGAVVPLQLLEVRHPTHDPAVLAIPGRSVGVQWGVAPFFVPQRLVPWPASDGSVQGTHFFEGPQSGRLFMRVQWLDVSHSTQAPVAALQLGSAPGAEGSGYFAPHATTPVLQPTQTLRARSHRGAVSVLQCACAVHATHSPRLLQKSVFILRSMQALAGAPMHVTHALLVQMGLPPLGQSGEVRQSTHLPVVRWQIRVVALVAVARVPQASTAAVGSLQATQAPPLQIGFDGSVQCAWVAHWAQVPPPAHLGSAGLRVMQPSAGAPGALQVTQALPTHRGAVVGQWPCAVHATQRAPSQKARVGSFNVQPFDGPEAQETQELLV